ncbi:MAG: hypothetical protein ACYC63_19530 [Armatimonadota bacterium]
MLVRGLALKLAVPALLTALIALSGCARGGEGAVVGPNTVIDFYARFAGPINDAYYYFIPIDADGDLGQDGPVPVAAGPYWENGWGTGSFTHYIEYHQGQYNVYRTLMVPTLTVPGGGILAIGGAPSGSAPGTSLLTVETITFGAVTVDGAGMITAATNTAFQSAGTLTLTTNAAGEVVANSAAFTPATVGGRALTPAEQAAIDALNAGGVPLAPDSLSALGLTLTLDAAQADSQTLSIAPTTATVTNAFTPATGSTGASGQTSGTLTANTLNAGTNTVLPGAVVTVGDFVTAATATVQLDISPNAELLGPPFDYTLPSGGDTLRVTIDLATLGTNIPDLSVNFISVTELIFDPTITDPLLHTYDGLGRLGNRYVTFRTSQFQTINNSSGLFEQEMANDSTLQGFVTQQQKNTVDLIDWSITIRSLR